MILLILFYKSIGKEFTNLKYFFFFFLSSFFPFYIRRSDMFDHSARWNETPEILLPLCQKRRQWRIVAALATFDNRSTILVTREEAPEFGSKSFDVPRSMFLGKLCLSGSYEKR